MKYDHAKGVEILRYIISSGVTNAYHIMKAMYFADKYHLQKYGRQVNGNKYIAMDMGPVPSEMYDFIKAIRNHFITGFEPVNHHHIACNADPDTDWLSESDMEALDFGINEVKGLSMGAVMDKSHDEAYRNTDSNCVMTIENIVRQFDNADLVLEYLNR